MSGQAIINEAGQPITDPNQKGKSDTGLTAILTEELQLKILAEFMRNKKFALLAVDRIEAKWFGRDWFKYIYEATRLYIQAYDTLPATKGDFADHWHSLEAQYPRFQVDPTVKKEINTLVDALYLKDLDGNYSFDAESEITRKKIAPYIETNGVLDAFNTFSKAPQPNLDKLIYDLQRVKKAATIQPKIDNGLDYYNIWLEGAEDRLNNPTPKLSTGIENLDMVLSGGIDDGTVSLIGGFPGAGKSALTLQIVHHMAMQGRKVIMYNREMREKSIFDRIISRTNNIPLSWLRGGQEVQETLRRIKASRPEGLENILFGDNNNITIDNIREIVEENSTDAPAVLLLDYLQVFPTLRGKDITDPRVRLNFNLTLLREIVMDTNCIILAISSLNREGSKTGEITMHSFKESGDVEYTADYLIGLGLAKDDCEEKTGKPYLRMLNMIEIDEAKAAQEGQENIIHMEKLKLLKSRNDYTGNVKLYFDMTHQNFTSTLPDICYKPMRNPHVEALLQKGVK